jgi:hypothetical protein
MIVLRNFNPGLQRLMIIVKKAKQLFYASLRQVLYDTNLGKEQKISIYPLNNYKTKQYGTSGNTL